MNKSELVEAIAKQADVTKVQAEAVLNATVASVTKALKKGDKVQLVGFGTFEVRKRAARTGRNPKTGATIKIAARKTPAFSAGKSLMNSRYFSVVEMRLWPTSLETKIGDVPAAKW